MKKIIISLFFFIIATFSLAQSVTAFTEISCKYVFRLIPETIGSSAITNYKYITGNCSTWGASSHELTLSLLCISNVLSNCNCCKAKHFTLNNSGIADGSGADSLSQKVSNSLGIDLMAGNNTKTFFTATVFC